MVRNVAGLMRSAAIAAFALVGGCEAYAPQLCQPCIDAEACGPGLECIENFCMSSGERCEAVRGIVPYFPERDGVCDLVAPVDGIDTSKIVSYYWLEPVRPKVIVGRPGAAPPGTIRVALAAASSEIDLADAWVQPDGSFSIELPQGHRFDSERWTPVDDDGDVCGPSLERWEGYQPRAVDPPLRHLCLEVGSSWNRRCVFVGPEKMDPSAGSCTEHPEYAWCLPPTDEPCAVSTDCIRAPLTTPFPFEQIHATNFFEQEVWLSTAELEPGTLLVAELSRTREFKYALGGTDQILALHFPDVGEWRVWLEYPRGGEAERSEFWAITASVAASLPGVND